MRAFSFESRESIKEENYWHMSRTRTFNQLKVGGCGIRNKTISYNLDILLVWKQSGALC
jgi:hypothetical protein